MENYKFEKLIEKALKDKIFGNDEYEYMQYHPENIKGDILYMQKKKKETWHHHRMNEST